MSAARRECVNSGISYIFGSPPFLKDAHHQLHKDAELGLKNHQQKDNLHLVDRSTKDSNDDINIQQIKSTLTNLKPVLPEALREKQTKNFDKEALKKGIISNPDELSSKPVTNIARKEVKRKTVAFGRTTNLSQTVEGKSLRKVDCYRLKRRNRVNADETTELREMVMGLKVDLENLKEMEEKYRLFYRKFDDTVKRVQDLEKRQEEHEMQCLKLTDTIKALLIQRREKAGIHSRNARRTLDADLDKPSNSKSDDKENVSLKAIVKDDTKNKLEVIGRKMETDPKFQKCVDELLRRFCKTDEMKVSRNIIASKHSSDTTRVAGHRVNPSTADGQSSAKQTTGHEEASPIRSAVYSYETRKYFARYGVPTKKDIGAGSVERIEEYGVCTAEESLYVPGKSKMYYPISRNHNARFARIENLPLRDTQRKALRPNSQRVIFEEEALSDSGELLSEQLNDSWLEELVG